MNSLNFVNFVTLVLNYFNTTKTNGAVMEATDNAELNLETKWSKSKFKTNHSTPPCE